MRRAGSITFVLRLYLFGALACLPSLAAAAEPKPDVSIQTKAIDATVFLDNAIKADPALAANCLAEGRKWAEKGRADADSERKDSPELFRNGAWSYERKYETRSVVAGRMSASSATTTPTPAARIPIRTLTASCGTGRQTSASALGRSSARPPTTARR